MEVSDRQDSSLNQIKAKVHSIMYFGTFERIVAALPDKSEVVIHRFDQKIPVKVGQDIYIHVDPEVLYTFGPDNL